MYKGHAPEIEHKSTNKNVGILKIGSSKCRYTSEGARSKRSQCVFVQGYNLRG